MLSRTLGRVAIAVLVIGSSRQVMADPWTEIGDAGELLGTAQVTQGAGALTAISGVLQPNQADMFRITISSPIAFSATTEGLTTLDTMLFLFAADGQGVYYNDDTPGALGFQSTLPANHPASPSTPGDYYLAIGGFSRTAQSAGGSIWLGLGKQVLAPNGPGAGSPLSFWSGSSSATGSYTIALTGASFSVAAPVPEPTILALTACGIAIVALRRARSRAHGTPSS